MAGGVFWAMVDGLLDGAWGLGFGYVFCQEELHVWHVFLFLFDILAEDYVL